MEFKLNDLNKKITKKDKVDKENFSYSIKIADFYYRNTAQIMVSRIKSETSLKNAVIKKLSETNLEF